MIKKVCIPLTTRGNYAKMKSLIAAINKDEQLELQLLLGGMVVLEKYGRIFEVLEEQGYTPERTINFVIEGENLATMAKSSGLAMIEFASAFEQLKPDIVVVIADRFECLPIAMAAAYMNIPVAHVEGGEVTGSIDESIRHAITKLAHMHFAASDDAAKRIVKLGEDEATVFKVGASSLDELMSLNLDDLGPVISYQKDYGVGPIIDLEPQGFITVIQHPVTTEYDSNLRNIEETIAAVSLLNLPTVWVMPNMDAGADGANKAIRRFRDSEASCKTHFFKSLPIELFGPTLKNSICIIGNSSSGIRESAFLGTPCVNIGTRQTGRERGHNVIDVDYDRHQIVTAVKRHLECGRYEPDFIYGDGQASLKMLHALKKSEIRLQKKITY